MSKLQSRIRRKSLHNKIANPEELIPLFKDGMNLGWSGFTPVGYPKVMPVVLADHVEQNNLQGKLRFNLFIGASVGVETEDRWATLDMIDRRWPYQTGKNIAEGDQHRQDPHGRQAPGPLRPGHRLRLLHRERPHRHRHHRVYRHRRGRRPGPLRLLRHLSRTVPGRGQDHHRGQHRTCPPTRGCTTSSSRSSRPIGSPT